jgi:hypothetical protein
MAKYDKVAFFALSELPMNKTFPVWFNAGLGSSFEYWDSRVSRF